MGEHDDRLDDGCAGVVVGVVRSERVDEGPVDLQDVEVQVPQIGERRVPRAEVVDRDAHAEVADPDEQGEGRGPVLEEGALGQLEHETLRVGPVPFEGGGHEIGEGIIDLDAADVDGEVDVGPDAHARMPPLGQPTTGLVQDPEAQFVELVGLLEDGHEAAGGNRPELGIGPAHQHFGPDQVLVVASAGPDRLVLDGHLAPLDGGGNPFTQPVAEEVAPDQLDRAFDDEGHTHPDDDERHRLGGQLGDRLPHPLVDVLGGERPGQDGRGHGGEERADHAETHGGEDDRQVVPVGSEALGAAEQPAEREAGDELDGDGDRATEGPGGHRDAQHSADPAAV